MKEAIASFIKNHPFLTFFIVDAVATAARNTIVEVSQAITGNYPPVEIKPAISVDAEEAEKAESDEDATADSTESD
jgi:hypothetical protein